VIVSFSCVFVFLRFGFGLPGVVIVVPVHVRKRKPGLKPATTAHFFLSLPAAL
jgi:hypothetical protein